jgi:hypothetical protein
MAHKHEAVPGHTTRLDSGRITEHCECGSIRITRPDGTFDIGTLGGRFNSKCVNGWHTCDLCTPGATARFSCSGVHVINEAGEVA